jgi:rhomboid protease GluP
LNFRKVPSTLAGVDSLAPNHAHPPLTISVRDRRQAMDWSLVLASQGIAAVIDHEETSDRWCLRVEASDSQRALATLKLYHLENRGWHWEQPLPWAGVTFHWGAAFWCLFLAFVHGLVANGAVALRESGMMDGPSFLTGEWWRVFTAMSLHGDAAHLIANATTGFVLFGLVMARFGAGPGLLAAWLAGAIGYLPGLFIYGVEYRALGASGMVMAALGMIATESFALGQGSRGWRRRTLAAVAGGIMLFVLLGSNPESDLVAHLGGFLAGCSAGMALGAVPHERLHARTVRAAALFLLLSGVGLTWLLALGT